MMTMKPNKVGWILAGFFLIAGIAFAMAPATRLLGSIWIVVSLFLIGLYSFMNLKVGREAEFRRSALPARAKVTDFTDTGMTINQQPIMKLGLEIHADGMTPYNVEYKTMVPRAAVGQLTTGGFLAAWVDRKDKQKIRIDWGTPSAMVGAPGAIGEAMISTAQGSIDLRNNPAAREAVIKALKQFGIDVAHQTAADDPSTPVQESKDPVSRMQKLKELRAAGLINEAEFQDQRKKIVEEI